jgi:hypothetical protein
MTGARIGACNGKAARGLDARSQHDQARWQAKERDSLSTRRKKSRWSWPSICTISWSVVPVRRQIVHHRLHERGSRPGLSVALLASILAGSLSTPDHPQGPFYGSNPEDLPPLPAFQDFSPTPGMIGSRPVWTALSPPGNGPSKRREWHQPLSTATWRRARPSYLGSCPGS